MSVMMSVKRKNFLLCCVFVILGLALSSCMEPLPGRKIDKGTLKTEDIYGNWVHKFDVATATLIFRKDVYRISMKWNDGTSYESGWNEWNLEWSEDADTYILRCRGWADDLLSNWDRLKTAPQKSEVRTGYAINNHLVRIGDDLHIVQNIDKGITYEQVSHNNGAISPEDEPPKEEPGNLHKVTIEMSMQDVEKLLGKPDRIQTPEDHVGTWLVGTSEVWNYGEHGRDGTVYFDTNRKVKIVYEHQTQIAPPE